LLCGAAQPGSAAGRPALAEVADAIAEQALRFQVCLDETTVTLGTLQSLHVGDVLPLSHRLDQPLRVVAHGASTPRSPFWAAYLGSRDHHRAVELVPAAPASHQIAS
jgi:flagellar motor switch protein FliM